MFFISGTQDPLSKKTKAVRKAMSFFKNAGVSNIQHKFYEGARHELTNEINREDVYRDVAAWLNNINTLAPTDASHS